MRVYRSGATVAKQPPVEEKPESVTVGPQMTMELRPSLEQLIADTKYRLRSRQHELELQPFWNSFSIILAIISGVMLTLISLGGFLIKFDQLPPEVPIYYDANLETWHPVEKSILFIAVIGYAVWMGIIVKLISMVFVYDKRLARISSWLIVFLNFMTILAVAQIISLISTK